MQRSADGSVAMVYVCAKLQQNSDPPLPMSSAGVQRRIAVLVRCRQVGSLIDKPSSQLVRQVVERQCGLLEDPAPRVQRTRVENGFQRTQIPLPRQVLEVFGRAFFFVLAMSCRSPCRRSVVQEQVRAWFLCNVMRALALGRRLETGARLVMDGLVRALTSSQTEVPKSNSMKPYRFHPRPGLPPPFRRTSAPSGTSRSVPGPMLSRSGFLARVGGRLAALP